MRPFPLILILLAASLSAAEPTPPSYPLWDNTESVADYAKKVNLPPTRTLDLGNGVKLELVLIPAGKFIMGTPQPTPVDEKAFRNKIMFGQALLAACGGVLAGILVVVIGRALLKRRRPQLSLRFLLIVTVTAGGAVMSGLHWRESAKALESAKSGYTVSQARFKNANKSEKPAHPVTLTQPYYLGKYAVTQEQYQAVMGSNSSQFRGKNNPADQVLWEQAQDFCRNATARTKENLRLPTEAEWEFACRAGTTSVYYSGDTVKDLDRVAWYKANSTFTTHPVGQKDPNAFGLYDMHGNVWQYCQDLLDVNYYATSPAENPPGTPVRSYSHIDGAYPVMRGGSWCCDPVSCRSAERYSDNPLGFYQENFGFRVALTPALPNP